jgi:hypothetical protein
MALTKVSYSMIAGSPANAIDFGVDNTGVADCSAQLQAAINSATAAGNSLFIGSGTFKISSPVSITCSIQGLGTANTKLVLSRGLTINTSGVIIQGVRFSSDDGVLNTETGQLQIADNVTNVQILDCQFGDVVNTNSAYTDTALLGSYCLLISQEGCKNTIVRGCLFKKMRKTTVTNSPAIDGFTGGVFIYSPAVLVANNASTVQITDCTFEDMSSPGATVPDNSDADAIRQLCPTMSDNERYGSLAIRGCTFREIVKSAIKIASFSNVSTSDCDIFAATSALGTEAGIRYQYALNSSMSDIRLYGEFSYGIVSQGSNVSVNGVYHSNSKQVVAGGTPSFGTVNGRINNTLVLMAQSIGNDYVYISNVTGINCKQVLIVNGPSLTVRAGTNNVIVSNVYATLNDFGITSGTTAVCDFADIENVVLSNVNLLPPFKDDGTFDLTGITRYGIQTVRINKLTVQDSSIYFSNRAIDFGDNTESWANPRSLVVQNCQFESVDSVFGDTRVISFGVAAATNLEFVKLSGLTFKVPMADAYGKNIIQGLNTDLLEVSDVQVKHTTVNTNYARVVEVDVSVDRSVVSNIIVTASTDLGALTSSTSNPVVYSFDGTNCTIDNIDGGFQDGVVISNSFVLGSLTNIKATNNALFVITSAAATTYLEKASIRTNGIVYP